MSSVDKNERTTDDFEQQLRRLVEDAYESGTDLDGAYVASIDEQTDLEILITDIER